MRDRLLKVKIDGKPLAKVDLGKVCVLQNKATSRCRLQMHCGVRASLHTRRKAGSHTQSIFSAIASSGLHQQ